MLAAAPSRRPHDNATDSCRTGDFPLHIAHIGMATHYYTVAWDQLHRDARALAWRLMDKGPFAGIIAITRGGLIPAAIIARELDIRLIESVSVVTYNEETRGTPVVTKPPAAAGDGTGFLIIDDLVDTGTTA